jgi:4,5-dihydroxyphthalate decarboxylase
MARLQISVGCGDYDRTRAIHDGRVEIEGCQAITVPLEPEEVFFRAFRHQAFDVAELSFSSYLTSTAAGTCPYIAVPAFLSRAFRHSGIYVRRDGPVRRPEDLRGRQVGVPEYQVTAAVWIRALLQDDFKVAPSDVTWVTGGIEEPGRHEKLALSLPPEIRVEPAPPGRALGEMLVAGDIDALVSPRPPASFTEGKGPLAWLFEDPAAAAADYFRRTGLFPIMHLLGLRRTLAEAHPWLPGSLLKAFRRARDLAMARLDENAALAVSLPFMVEEAARTRALMGADFWPYGVEENRATIEALLEHHHRQGLSPRRLTIEELFHPSTFERFRV